MICGLLRRITGVALRWFDSDIRIERAEKIPASGPLLIAVNHQNALVDSLIVAGALELRFQPVFSNPQIYHQGHI
jgi:1-acyl-sn-glycerol-3-phosphate acyltransferase